MNDFSNYNINSGEGLYHFLVAAGVYVSNTSSHDDSQNVIELPDLTTFNWKKRDQVIRINCKEHAKLVIEAKTGLKHFDNGPGDPTRPFSFFAENLSDLVDIIYALKSIDGNKGV